MSSSLWLLDGDRLRWSWSSTLAASRSAGARLHILETEFGVDPASEARLGRLYEMVGPIALIRMYGPLFDDDLILPRSGLSGYGGLAAQYEAAQADPEVKGVLFDIDSPGGVGAPALQDLADDLFRGRVVKPSVANVRNLAASAAYWIASSAGAVVVPKMGELGSIGVWTLHIDVSGMLDEAGIKPTLIFSGAHKVDGNPFEPLPDSVRVEWQAEVDTWRGWFAESVARGRALSVESVLATEARIYPGDKARDVGLADDVLPRKTALQTLIDSVG